MKKHILFALLALVGLASCQKEMVTVVVSAKENGHIWRGWEIKSPVAKFDSVEQNIHIGDKERSNAGAILQGKELASSGPKTVYAVQPFIQGNFFNMKNDLERRGWKIAELSYLLAVTKEYGFDSNQLWNIYCLNVPGKAAFEGGNPEEFAVQAWGNHWSDQTQKLYRLGINFIQFSNNYSGIEVLCYR